MTTTQLEHLRKIDAHLEYLIAHEGNKFARNALAGWEATRAVIAFLEYMNELFGTWVGSDRQMAAAILAAFPLDLIEG